MHNSLPYPEDAAAKMDNFMFILGSERMPDSLTAAALFELMQIECQAIITGHETGRIPAAPDTLHKARMILQLATARLDLMQTP